MASRRGSTLLWAAKQAETIHPRSSTYKLSDLNEYLQKDKNEKILKDLKEGKGAILFLSENFQIKDIATLIENLSQCDPKSFYLHWTIPLSLSDLTSQALEIPEEISSLTIKTEAIFSCDNYSELLLYRKSKANIQSFFIVYLNQDESTIECSLNGLAAIEVWFLLKYHLEKGNSEFKDESIVFDMIQETVRYLRDEKTDEFTYFNYLEKLKRLLILAKIDKFHHKTILSLQSTLDDFRQNQYSFYQNFMGGPSSFEMTVLFKSFRNWITNFPSMFFDFHDKTNKLYEMQEKIINFLAKRHKIDDAWGYLTSGGSESNEWGIFQGRYRYPNSKIFFSASAHYCLEKIARYYAIPYEKVNANNDDRINLEDLMIRLRENLEYPPIIILTYGTTQKATMDDLKGVYQLLKQLNIKEYYIHIDGALMAAALPEKCDYSENPFDSICFSAHKFIGCQKIGSILICDNRRNQKKIDTLSEKIDGKTLLEIYLTLMNGGSSYLEKKREMLYNLSKYFQQRLKKFLPKEDDIKTFPDSFYFHFNKSIIKGLWYFGSVSNDYSKACILPANKGIIDRFLSETGDYQKY